MTNIIQLTTVPLKVNIIWGLFCGKW